VNDAEGIELGGFVRCTVTGLAGVVTGLADYLHRSPQVQVTRPHPQWGQPETLWLDLAAVQPVERDAPPGHYA
jgi:hypothetical protein